jgi:hypothetical protein
MSIGRLSNSLVSGTNENTLALVNFNIDFSLLKLEAPQEFSGLGLSLTRQRRELAEEGPVHRTARRLGALFENVVPNSPTLIRAYGSRVSEISQKTAKGDIEQRHGVFAECVGVDGTSVWAAATSGKSSLSLHLLACMLARAWSGPEATSIWVELVEERKRSLRKQISDGLYDSSVQLSLAVSEDITRNDLAHWDTSTRAWLQIADDSEIRRQKQLMLIVNNVNIPVNQGNRELTTYTRVVEAWKTSVEALEKLINGQSQSVSKGSVLLGLASWHLYPNLLVLGERIAEIEFNDELIKGGGQLTIGLQDPDPNRDEGVYWSLSLAHLRFYGDPVKVTSFTTRDASRLSIDEFHLLVFGSILSDWGSLHARDFIDAANFFVALDTCVCSGYKGRDNSLYRGRSPGRLAGRVCLNWKYGWVRLVGKACRDFLGLKEAERTIATSIIALGHRRGNRLLVKGAPDLPPPMLGLNHPWIQHMLAHALPKGTQDMVGMMRFIAESLGLEHDQCLISIAKAHKYVTAVPHVAEVAEGQPDRMYHISWHGRGSERSRSDESDESDKGPQVKTFQCPEIAAGEAIFAMLTGRKIAQSELDQFANERDKSISTGIINSYDPYSALKGTTCSCFYAGPGSNEPVFSLIAGDKLDVGLYVRIDGWSRERELQRALKQASRKPLSSIREVTEMLESKQIPQGPLINFLESLYDRHSINLPAYGKLVNIKKHNVRPYLHSLHAVSLASSTYNEVPGSTISLQLISRTLHYAKWLPPWTTFRLTRQQKFACIASLESGSYNVNPEELKEVIAISSRNSIFVSKLLLEDPVTLTHIDSITRVVGNVGKTGMVFMVAPQAPRVRQVILDNYQLVTHAPFDGKLEDSFVSTSLHLRFTEFEMPFNVGQRGAIDKDLCLVETLVQVFERDKWVADIDILALYDRNNALVRRNGIQCKGCSTAPEIPHQLRSMDNWEELLDTGESLVTLEVGVVRAHKNWLGRLAAACVSFQKGYRTVINPSEGACWQCSNQKDWGWQIQKKFDGAAVDFDREEGLWNNATEHNILELSPDNLELEGQALVQQVAGGDNDDTKAADRSLPPFVGLNDEDEERSYQLPQIFII